MLTLKTLKLKVLNWLLTDEKLRKVALREIIGDAEVKQINANNVKDLTISNCYLYNSTINNVEGFELRNNVLDYCSLTGFINHGKEGSQIK
jgi:hypothetical protein